MELCKRELNKQLCRERILKASRRLFNSKGYEQSTMEDVAEKAEVSKATLYNYFTSKDSLLLGIAEAELEDIHTLLRTKMREEPSSVKKLRFTLRTLVVDSIAYLPLSQKITYLNSREDGELYHIRAQLLDILKGLTESGQAGGELRRDVPAEEIVELLMGVYLVTQFHWTKLASYTEDYCIETLERLFDRMLHGVLLCEQGEVTS